MKGPLGSFMSPISLDQEEGMPVLKSPCDVAGVTAFTNNHISAAPNKGLAEKKRGAPADVAKSPRKKKTKTKYKGEIGSKSYKTTAKPRNSNTGIKRRDVEAETGMEEDVVSTADQIIAEEDGPPDAFAYDRTPLWIRANDGARLVLSCCVERCRKKDFRSLEDLCRHINRKENSNDHGLGNKITSHRHGLQLCGIVYDAADLCLIVKRKPDEEWPSENEGEDMVNNFTVPGREEQEVSEWYRKNESTQEDDDNLEDTDEGSSVYEHEERSRGAEDPHIPINTKGMTSQPTNPLNNQPPSIYSQHSLSSRASESKGKSRAHSSFATLMDESYSTLDDHQISTEHPLFGTPQNTFSIPDSEDERDQTLSNEKNERRVGQSRSSRGGQSGKLCLRQALTFSEARGASVEL